jgi:hypothetical protein
MDQAYQGKKMAREKKSWGCARQTTSRDYYFTLRAGDFTFAPASRACPVISITVIPD